MQLDVVGVENEKVNSFSTRRLGTLSPCGNSFCLVLDLTLCQFFFLFILFSSSLGIALQ